MVMDVILEPCLGEAAEPKLDALVLQHARDTAKLPPAAGLPAHGSAQDAVSAAGNIHLSPNG
ncbi:MAG: hypothetical protein Kow0073_02770 [Immundisolibacter sp.]